MPICGNGWRLKWRLAAGITKMALCLTMMVPLTVMVPLAVKVLPLAVKVLTKRRRCACHLYSLYRSQINTSQANAAISVTGGYQARADAPAVPAFACNIGLLWPHAHSKAGASPRGELSQSANTSNKALSDLIVHSW